MKREDLLRKAKKLAKRREKLRQDPRYVKVVGKLRAAGLIETPNVKASRGSPLLEDALWAAKIEPRIYELLPAIIVKHPKFFMYGNLPEDLGQVVAEMRRGRAESHYQGLSPIEYERWVPFVGRKGTYPSVMKSFRLKRSDLKLLSELADRHSLSQTEVIRKALEHWGNV